MSKVVVVCDSSFQIGTGHVSRCLQFAHRLADVGSNITFVSRNLLGNIAQLVESQGHRIHLLPSEDSQNLFEVSEADKNTLFDAVSKLKPDWILIDHYGLDYKFERRFRDCKIFVVDDLDRDHQCNAYLNPALNAAPSLSPETKLFLGPRFAILPDSFRATSIAFNSVVSTVFVFFGGTDPERMSLKFLRSIEHATMPFKFILVVGGKNPDLEEIKSIKNQAVELHIDTQNMAKLMLRSDIYLGSGGTVTWERAALGLSGLCISVAQNQVSMSKSLHDSEVHEYLGESQHWEMPAILEKFVELTLDHKRRKTFHENSLNLKVGEDFQQVLDCFR